MSLYLLEMLSSVNELEDEEDNNGNMKRSTNNVEMSMSLCLWLTEINSGTFCVCVLVD